MGSDLDGDAMTQLAVGDSADAGRYEARLGADLAGFLDYVVKHGRIALVHTEVLADHQGRGVGSALARFALDDARRRGLRVIPSCPYVRAYLERHPEDRDIVVGAIAEPG
jgi:predicted GNAT family acetyltransferase